MHAFIEQFKGSFWNGVYTSPETNFAGKAIKYIVILAVILGLIKAAFVSATVIPLIGDLKEYVFSALDRYPEDLVLKWRGGELSMNRPSPFLVPFEQKTSERDFENMLVIDTEADLDLETFDSYKTAILATETGFMVADDKGIRIDSFRDFPDYTLTKEILDSHRARISTIFGNFALLAYIALGMFFWMIFSIGTFIGALFWGLIGVLLALLVTRTKGYRLAFPNLFALSLYAMTVVLIIGTLEYLVPLPFLLSFIAFLTVLVLIPKKEPAAPDTPVQA